MISLDIRRFNRSKWDKDMDFYLSEIQKGHIDLISPWDRSFCDYWNIYEVYNTDIFESISNYYGLRIYETDDNFVIEDLFNPQLFFLLTDWIQYWKLKNINQIIRNDNQILEFQRMLNLKNLGV